MCRCVLRISGLDGFWPRRTSRHLQPRQRVLRPRGWPIRRSITHHPNHQRCAASADVHDDDLHHAGCRAYHGRWRHHHGAARRPWAVVDLGRQRSAAVALRRHRGFENGAAIPRDANPHRHREPRAARADHGYPRGASVCSRTRRGRSVRRGQHRGHRRSTAGRALAGSDVPHGDVHSQRLKRGRVVVRRRTHRQRRNEDRCAHCVPQLPRSDFDVGDDGHVHGCAHPPRRCVRRTHQRSARHRVIGCALCSPHHRPHQSQHARTTRRWLPLSRCRCSGARRHLAARHRRTNHRNHRQHWLWQDNVAEFDPTALRRHVGLSDRERCRRARPRPRSAVGTHWARSPKAVSLLGHRCQQPPLRRPQCHRRRPVGRTRNRPSNRFRLSHAGPTRCPNRPRWLQRFWRPAPTTGNRSSLGA